MANRKRHFDPADASDLLEALRVAREGCIRAGHKAPIKGEVYQSVQKVMDAIDEAALVLTGRRDHFWSKAHMASMHPLRDDNREA